MRASKLFGKTLRDDPAEVELASHRLMLRAGMIYQVSSGVYSYLPLAWRSLRKIEQIIRDEVDSVGGQEVKLSALQPSELWQQSGRYDDYGSDMFRLYDRRKRTLVLAPTHEELLTEIVNSNVHSYRDLPFILYQIQTKFRDEQRPRGGLIRVREFDMKDAYSFDVDEKGLDASYQAMVGAYRNIYSRCGLDATMVDADSGTIGGKDSQEFILLTQAGEDSIVTCEACGYAANIEKATFLKPEQEIDSPGLMEEVHTPGVKTIEDLAEHLNISNSDTLKVVFYTSGDELYMVVIRGDLDVNETKLKNALGGLDVRISTPDEVSKAGMVAGSASPVGMKGVRVIADDSIRMGSDFVVGANRLDYHLRNVNFPRDFEVDVFDDIALVQDGYECSICKDVLTTKRGIEVGHVFKLGTRYSELIGAYFSDESDIQRPIIMGCYGIGVGRLFAAAVEQNHDGNGMVLPVTISPYGVSLIALNLDNKSVADAANMLYRELWGLGVEVLYDDRFESAGVKFKDADLLGLPIRLVISSRTIQNDTVEVKERVEGESYSVSRKQVVGEVEQILKRLSP